MSDYHQRGPITTLPRLNAIPLEEIERRLETLAASHPTALILPCTFDDLRSPAMACILRELRQARYLAEIVISVNQAGADEPPEVADLTGDDPRITLLWNDNPALQALLPEPRSGKGFNLWTALGWLSLRGGCEFVLLHDCDILCYSRAIPARLAWPLLDPALGYRFVKGYYPRLAGNAGGPLFGRVTRLFVGPLLRALVRVEGHHPLLDFLDSFRYPLAGEWGARLDDLADFPLPEGWQLEMDLLCSAHRALPLESVAQISLGSNYEHKHQAASDTGLLRLAAEISACLFVHLAAEGMRITADFLSTLRTAYLHAARDTVRRYRHVAIVNGMEFNEAQERELVEAFAAQLELRPFSPPLPDWTALQRTRPDWCDHFQQIVGNAK